MDEVLEKVKVIAKTVLGVENVVPSVKFSDDLGIDSLDFLEFVMAVEDKFGIEIDDSDISKLKTVKDVCDFVLLSVKR